MYKRFCVTGACIPEKNYMVDITSRIDRIKKDYIEHGEYITINRARQYGKTTTLYMLEQRLREEYLVLSLSFEAADEYFQSFSTLAQGLILDIGDCLREQNVGEDIIEEWEAPIPEGFPMRFLGRKISSLCRMSEKKTVLMIDEVDKSSDNQIFLSFLGLLREKYLKRQQGKDDTFQSVILAGGYDVKTLKLKLHLEEEAKYNSPWNIAADFDVDMELSGDGIKGMLDEYEADHQTGMDTGKMAGFLYDYTSGYPYLVSRLCKLMDEKISDAGTVKAWTKEGFLEAVRLLLLDNNTLFESLIGKLSDYPRLGQMLRELLFSGKAITYTPTNQVVNLALMFGFVRNEEGKVIPANRIFDTLLYNHFLSLDEMEKSDMYKASLQDKNIFIRDGHLDMRRILERFVLHFHELYGDREEEFLEEEGRRYFLLYLRPIINGTGNYYVEARTRSLGRTDIIVDYRGEQMIIETKIWRGNEYNSRGERQLEGYLDDYGLRTGYMLSFCFNRKKQVGVREVKVGNKEIIEAVV